MARQQHQFTFDMDEGMWDLLNRYTRQVTRLVRAKGGRTGDWQDRRVRVVVNAILTKFLQDNAERIRHVDQYTQARELIRQIPDPGLRAQAAEGARLAFTVRVGGSATTET